MGCKVRVRFWTDKWCEDEVLPSRFLLIYRLVVDMDASVASYFECSCSCVLGCLASPSDSRLGDGAVDGAVRGDLWA